MKRWAAVLLVMIAMQIEHRATAEPEISTAPQASQAPTTEVAPDPEAEKKLDAQIARHVQNLGSRFGKNADQAEAALIDLGDRANAALEEAAKSPNDQVAIRARRALEKINAHSHVVLDATGKPVVGGKLKMIYEGNTVTLVPDKRGRISAPEPTYEMVMTARFTHPELGSMQGPIELGPVTKNKRRFLLSLVNQDSPEYQRALRGIVRGPGGKPVAGAIITSAEVFLPDETDISMGTDYKAITDREGRFVYYPIAEEFREITELMLVPAGSSFFVTVEPPPELNLFPLGGDFKNTSEIKIELEQPEHFHKFKFEQRGGGFVEDPQLLKEFWITYAKTAQSRPVTLRPEVVMQGGKLLPGMYTAGRSSLNYLPLEVKEGSPEELIFRRQPSFTLRGKVVDAVTGKPMPKVFILGYRGIGRQTLAALTADQWKALREMPAGAPLDHPALAAISPIYNLSAAVRTDDEGRYEVVQESDDELYALIAVEENYLPIQQIKHRLTLTNQRAEVPDLKLFPAARVFIKPMTEANTLVVPFWHFEKNGPPQGFPQPWSKGDYQHEFLFAHSMELDVLQPIYVPSDVDLKLQLKAPNLQEVSAVLLPKTIHLKQGETLSLGEVKLPAAIRLDLEVVDSKGEPLEGVVLHRIYDEEEVSSPSQITDAKGQASFFINLRSSGRFQAERRSYATADNDKDFELPFRVEDAAPPGKTYRLTLSDEQIKALRVQ